MPEMVTLTLTGAKRYTVAGTAKTVLQWEQVRVDAKTAEHLMDQYFVDGNNNERPYFEEGKVEPPPPRADGRRGVRASQRRLDREKAKLEAAARAHLNPDDAENYDSIRGDGTLTAQDPYGRNKAVEDDPPDGLEHTNTHVVMETADDLKEQAVIEKEAERLKANMVVEDAPKAEKPKAKTKRSANKKAPARRRRSATKAT